jgi:porin
MLAPVSRAASHGPTNYLCTSVFIQRTTVAIDRCSAIYLRGLCTHKSWRHLAVARQVLSSQRVEPTSHFGYINRRSTWRVAASTVLIAGCSLSPLAQTATGKDEHPALPAQPAAVASDQTQAPPATEQTQTPAATTVRSRRLNCQHPANPSKRRFGCKDQDFEWDETLTADWNGARAEAKKLGITPTGSYFSALQTNERGGPHQIWSYTGQLTTAVDFDFGKLFKIPGMSLYVSDSWGTGSNLTATIGSVFPVNIDLALGAYMGEIYLQQRFLKDNLTVAAGRLAASYTFAGLPVFDNYVSLAINPTPVSLLSNDSSYAGPPPGLEWGVQAVYTASPVVQVAAGVFNTNPNSATNGNIFAFQQGNKGALVTAQVSCLYNQRPNDEGKEGQYTAGFFADNNSFAALPSGNSKSDGNSGVFVLGQQTIYRPEGSGSSQGLTIWGAWAYSSKQLVSPMPLFGGAGFSYEGLFKKRNHDTINAGLIYAKTSRYIPNASAAKLFEANYQWVAKRYVVIVPDFQYIWNANGTNGKGASVLGVQVNLTF